MRSIPATIALCFAACALLGAASPAARVVDESAVACAVSFDGAIWYEVPAGRFAPLEVRYERCAARALGRTLPLRPSWAVPRGRTQARFVALSLQQAYSLSGMKSIAADAHRYGIPVTWMIGYEGYLRDAALYNAWHAAYGDDVQTFEDEAFMAAMHLLFPWYRASVSVAGAGAERRVVDAYAHGRHAFWGIAWNSHGVDGTYDEGAPWGTYCADLDSYKRPAPDGSCGMVAFEWTARDLTRAYLSGHEEWFSTEPDDLLDRAGFSVAAAARYAREIVDAYAAAAETQPLVVVSQQESALGGAGKFGTVLNAIYGQAVRDGMKIETLARAARDAARFSARPRAVAFPFLPGGREVPSPQLGGDTLYPATIDYHDTRAGMTFLAGHTLPTRVYRYADAKRSRFDRALPQLPASAMPRLHGASVERGELVLRIDAPQALHFGVALWSDPSRLRLRGAGVTPAGRAGAVVTFDLRPGENRVAIPCAGCTSTTLAYST